MIDVYVMLRYLELKLNSVTSIFTHKSKAKTFHYQGYSILPQVLFKKN